MNASGRIVTFITVVLVVWTGMNVYAASRLLTLPAARPGPTRTALLALLVLLWLAFPLGRILAHFGPAPLGRGLELVGGIWLGVVFLLLVFFLAADLVTGFGRLLPGPTPAIRQAAALAALGLATIAVAQGLRPPAVREEEVTLPGLPPELDGARLVQISDLHLGSLLGRDFLAAIVDRVLALEPDLIAVTGDLVDGDPGDLQALLPELRRLRAPLGVWAVTGNHEYYAGLEGSLALLEAAGFRVLRDSAAVAAPGLVVAGVDDLTARRQLGLGDAAHQRALDGRPPGATVLLSHSPLSVPAAARAGAGLMLSGHTHGGQIWPFGHLVQLAYPDAAPRRQVGTMTLVVCRGTGTWGPRMRLLARSEIVRLRLRSA